MREASDLGARRSPAGPARASMRCEGPQEVARSDPPLVASAALGGDGCASCGCRSCRKKSSSNSRSRSTMICCSTVSRCRLAWGARFWWALGLAFACSGVACGAIDGPTDSWIAFANIACMTASCVAASARASSFFATTALAAAPPPASPFGMPASFKESKAMSHHKGTLAERKRMWFEPSSFFECHRLLRDSHNRIEMGRDGRLGRGHRPPRRLCVTTSLRPKGHGGGLDCEHFRKVRFARYFRTLRMGRLPQWLVFSGFRPLFVGTQAAECN